MAFDLLTGLTGNIVAAIVIVLIGLILAKVIDTFLKRGLAEIELNKLVKNAGLKIDLQKILRRLTMYFIILFAIIMGLNQIGITTTVLNILVAGIVILVVITLVLSVKDFIPNAFAGLMMQRTGFFKEGDFVKVGDLEGTVVKINIAETEIKTAADEMVYVPNSTLYKRNFRVKKSS